MVRKIFLILLIFKSTIVFAELDLKKYDLNEEQVNIIRKIEKKDKYSESFLMKIVRASLAHNAKEVEYVPEHSIEELELVKAWAVGSTFKYFARQLKINFNNDAYMESYPVVRDGSPYMAIFNFGLATSDEYFEIDVITTANNLFAHFSRQQHKLNTDFKAYFLKQAEAYGFRIFIDLP